LTAEVAVLNSIGVALAADSAVTVRGNSEKIYTTAEKLLRLSEYEPIGIMVYGSAYFENIPWETIIKVYRKYLGNKKFNTVKEYAENFLNWLTRNIKMFPIDARNNQLIRLIISYYYYLRENVIKTKLDTLVHEEGCVEEEQLPDLLHQIIKDHITLIRKKDLFEGFSDEDKKKIKKVLSPLLADPIKEIFGNLPFNTYTKRMLVSIAIEVSTRQIMGPLTSGIVIAGFGELQYKPALISYEVEEMVNRKIRLIKGYDVQMINNDAVVAPFAQKDMVYSFMEGIDREISQFMGDSTKELLSEFKMEIIKYVKEVHVEIGSILEDNINIEKIVNDLIQSWDEERRKYVIPVLEIVSSLPKNELAEMAESLVSITKLRRKITTVPETVGGPVDVAIITKGDGFVWMQRKHYFDASLNQHLRRFQTQEDCQ
jgi:hypothetical protein